VPDARLLIGLDLAEAAFSGAVVDLRGGVVRAASLPLEGRRQGRDRPRLPALLIDEDNGGLGGRLLGVGIGAPGVIDSERGVIRWAVNLDWADVPLGSLVSERYGIPVAFANDSQAAALAEHSLGGRAPSEDLVVIRVGRGIGAGVILGGRLFQGDGFGAGEIGHTTVVTRGDRCRCGRNGCLETVASMRSLVARAAERRAIPSRPEDAGTEAEAKLVDAFRSGQRLACSIVLEGAQALGRAIGALIGALSLRRIAIVGPAAAFGPEWLQEVREAARTSALPLLSEHVAIEFGEVHDDAVILGVAALRLTNELGLSVSR